MKALLIILLISLFGYNGIAQYGHVDHWETAIFVSEEWRYFVGTQAPDTNWNETNFNQTAWLKGKGGLGFGDSNLTTIIPRTPSLYLRKEFTVKDKAKIQAAILSADWDDGFVAYLNGFEIARENIGTAWVEPKYNEFANYVRNAQLIEGGDYNDFLIRKNQINYAINDGKNVLAIQIHNVSNVSSDIVAFFNLHFGLIDSDNQFAPAPAWFKVPPIFTDSSNLPIVRITSARLNDSNKISGVMEITWHGEGKRNSFYENGNHYSGRIGIKYRGNSTLQFPKKSFTVETRDAGGNAEDVSLLGLPADNDWVLYAPYSDKSLLRNYLAYNIGQATGEYAPRTRLVELYHNGYYIGVYVLIEKIKRGDQRVNVNKLTKKDTNSRSITGGYILKKDWVNDSTTNSFYLKHDNKFEGYQNNYIQYYKPKFDSLTISQRKYIEDFMWNFENSLLSDDFKNLKTGYTKYIDINSFADYFISKEMAKEIDAYRFSMFMYKNHQEDDGLLHIAPIWDYNLGYGNIDFGIEHADAPRGWMYDNEGARVFWFDRMLEDPLFADALDCRWRNYRMTSMTNEKIMRIIDDAVTKMDSASIRNHYTWKTLGRYVWPNKFVGDTYEEEIDYLKNWLQERLEYMDVHIMGYCRVPLFLDEEVNKEENKPSVFPNPTQSQIKIKSESEIKNVQLYNTLGKLLLSKTKVNSKELILQLSNFPVGLYMLHIQDVNGNTFTNKVVRSE